MQVHTLQRGLVHSLASAGADHLLYRYRVEFRAQCADEMLRPEWGVTHTADVPLWFFGNRSTLTESEKGVAERAILGPFTRFVNGEKHVNWGTGGYRDVRTVKSDGRVEIWKDELWDEALRVWGILRAADRGDDGVRSRL